MNMPMPGTEIPTLDVAQRLSKVPERLAVALDARNAEKLLQEQLALPSLNTLRPELAHWVRETLEREAQDRWHQQAARFDTL